MDLFPILPCVNQCVRLAELCAGPTEVPVPGRDRHLGHDLGDQSREGTVRHASITRGGVPAVVGVVEEVISIEGVDPGMTPFP